VFARRTSRAFGYQSARHRFGDGDRDHRRAFGGVRLFLRADGQQRTLRLGLVGIRRGARDAFAPVQSTWLRCVSSCARTQPATIDWADELVTFLLMLLCQTQAFFTLLQQMMPPQSPLSRPALNASAQQFAAAAGADGGGGCGGKTGGAGAGVNPASIAPDPSCRGYCSALSMLSLGMRCDVSSCSQAAQRCGFCQPDAPATGFSPRLGENLVIVAKFHRAGAPALLAATGWGCFRCGGRARAGCGADERMRVPGRALVVARANIGHASPWLTR
jgi:hypothetical protein